MAFRASPSVSQASKPDEQLFRNPLSDSTDAQVVFHGTNAHAYVEGEIESFITRPASGRGAAFFWSDQEIASQYGECIYSVVLAFTKPLIVFGASSAWSALSQDTEIDGLVTDELRKASSADANAMSALISELSELFGEENSAVLPKFDSAATTLTSRRLGDLPGLEGDGIETDAIVRVARRLGFDGVIFRQIQDSPTLDAGYTRRVSDVFAAFEPSQIKIVNHTFRRDLPEASPADAVDPVARRAQAALHVAREKQGKGAATRQMLSGLNASA